MLGEYVERWRLTPDGAPIVTPTSRLLPCLLDGARVMLKVALIDEEAIGGQVMAWWGGLGAARVLMHDARAILMERADERLGLADVARRQDDDASRIICTVVAQLHAPRAQAPLPLVSLTEWFVPLWAAANANGGLFHVAASTASELLDDQQESVVLHGDMHHGNVLDFGTRGWLAIDPKGLTGERYFDYANIFCNPDDELAFRPGRLSRQVRVVAEAAQLERSRLLRWVVAWAGLSAAFLVQDGLAPNKPLGILSLAAELSTG